MPVNDQQYLASKLESVFEKIQLERMEGVPILNPRLEVAAVSFRCWEAYDFGVMLTPWFMNLMLLPGEDAPWEGLFAGEIIQHQLPSGCYEFIVGEEKDIGQYQMCSLFSPMNEFEDQAAAMATATEVMLAVMDEEHQDTVSTHAEEIQRIWNGEQEDNETQLDEPVHESSLEARMAVPMSRRALLKGAFSGVDKQETTVYSSAEDNTEC